VQGAAPPCGGAWGASAHTAHGTWYCHLTSAGVQGAAPPCGGAWAANAHHPKIEYNTAHCCKPDTMGDIVSGAIEAVRGMRDWLPGEQRSLSRVRSILEQAIAEHGYHHVDLPIIESRELYLRKLGEELAGKVYEFSFGGRELALRPEWTASVLRAYVAHLQDQPLPLRLSYSGPVFRYERPQHLTYRQFNQVGVELLGGLAPRADAEVLGLACAGLDALGIRNYRVLIGHIGLVRSLLAHLDLADRTRGLLLWSLDRLRSEGSGAVRARLNEQLGPAAFDFPLPPGLNDEEAAQLLLRVFQATQVDLASGSRSPDEIVGRLLRKLRRSDPQPQLEQAIALLDQLSAIRGSPSEALPRLAQLLETAGLASSAYDELRAVLALLPAHGIAEEQVVIDFGLGRGLHYYSGLIFEIYDEEERQLCGGGRYDDLVLAFGGRQSLPAAGFAYGLERVVAATERIAQGEQPATELLVVAVDDNDYPYALTVAHRLRQHGHAAAVDVRNRRLADNLRDAARRNLATVIIVGAEERTTSTLIWRDLSSREERRLSLDTLEVL
jgi:histidyl-tRNA synthetase